MMHRFTRLRFCLILLATACATTAALFGMERAAALPPPGTTVRINLASPGTNGNVAISNDGRYLFFDSTSDVLAPGDNNAFADVFVRDLVNNTTQIVSLANGGAAQGNGNSTSPAVSSDGKVVAFVSRSTNLTGDAYAGGRTNVFVRVISTSQTIRINTHAGFEPNGDALRVNVSPDGNYVAFESFATNLTITPTQASTEHVYLWGPRGAAQLKLLSYTPAGLPCTPEFGTSAAFQPSVSANARYVAFASICNDILTPTLPVGFTRIFVRDMQTNALSLLSRQTGGAAQIDGVDNWPRITPDGRFVVFQSTSSALVAGDTNGKQDVFKWDSNSGTPNQLERASLAAGGVQLNGDSGVPTVSSDGRYVSFSSYATNAVAGDTNGASDIFIYDRNGQTTTRADLTNGGAQISGIDGYHAMSADGRYVAFLSSALELGANNSQVFRRDTVGATTVLASPPYRQPEANGNSFDPAVSDGGRYVAFETWATNLGFGGMGVIFQVVVRDQQMNVYRLMSYRPNTLGDQHSVHPSISGEATCWVAYESDATNLLVTGTNTISDTNGVRDVFASRCSGSDPVRLSEQVSTGALIQQSTAASRDPSISRDGNFVAFASDDTTLTGDAPVGGAAAQIYLANLLYATAYRNSVSRTLIRVSGWAGLSDGNNYHPSVSGDGRCVAWASTATNNLSVPRPDLAGIPMIYLRQIDPPGFRTTYTATLLSQHPDQQADYPRLSADCRYATWVETSPALTHTLYFADIYPLNDYNSYLYPSIIEVIDSNTGNQVTSISDDGRFITYCGYDNTYGNAVFRYDRSLKRRTLVSVPLSGVLSDTCTVDSALAADADGQFITWASFDDNLVISDTLGNADIFGRSVTATVVPSISFVTDVMTTYKGVGIAPLVVRRIGPPDQPAAVSVVPIFSNAPCCEWGPGWANPITFAAGEMNKTVPVYIGDTIVQGSPPLETVVFVATEPQTATLGFPAQLILRIDNTIALDRKLNLPLIRR
jgi:Tol biopolymer transport system component